MHPRVDNLTSEDLIARLGTLRRGSVVVLLGGTDVGKSTLSRTIVEATADKAGLLDTDVGQGSLAPPCAIGAAIVDDGVTFPAGMWFAGDVTPVRHIRDICDGAGKLLEHLRRQDPDLIVVDTCGLVGGKIGVVLKQRLIRAIGPDVIVAVERSNELAPILTPLTRSETSSTLIWKCVPSPDVRRKTPGYRRRYRNERLAAALDGAQPVTFALKVPAAVDAVGLVAGLIDASGFCLGIGVVEAVGDGEVVVNTAFVEVERVAIVKLGEMRIVVAPGRLGSPPQ